MQILCFDAMFWPLVAIHQSAINSSGRSDIYLKIMFTGNVITICLLVLAGYVDIVWVAVSSVVSIFLTFSFLACANRRLNHYKFREQLYDILQGVLPAVFVAGVVYFVSVFPLSSLWTLILQALGGILAFVGYSIVMRHEEMGMIIRFIANK